MPKSKRYVYRCKRDDGGRPHEMLTPTKQERCIAYVHGTKCGAPLVQKGGPRK